jgi:protein-disulfide isomerase
MSASIKLISIISVVAISLGAYFLGDKLIGKTAVHYMKNNPTALDEIIKAHTEFKEQEQLKINAALISTHKDRIFTTADGTPFIGNPDGTVQFTVFVEPFCGYCHQFKGTMDQLIEAHKDLKIIVRDIPFLAETSPMVVKALIASHLQGKYMAFQHALKEIEPSITEAKLMELAKSINLDTTRLKTDMESESVKKIIDSNLAIAKDLNLNATPLIVTQDQLLMGAAPLEKMTELLYGTTGKDTKGMTKTASSSGTTENTSNKEHKGS